MHQQNGRRAHHPTAPHTTHRNQRRIHCTCQLEASLERASKRCRLREVDSRCLSPHLRQLSCRLLPQSPRVAAGNGAQRLQASTLTLHKPRTRQSRLLLLAQSSQESSNGELVAHHERMSQTQRRDILQGYIKYDLLIYVANSPIMLTDKLGFTFSQWPGNYLKMTNVYLSVTGCRSLITTLRNPITGELAPEIRKEVDSCE